MAEPSSDSSQSLGRGIKLIEFLSDFPNGYPLARIAEETGLNKSTAHRLLKSLQSLGYVATTATPGSYRLTSKFISIGSKAFSGLNVIGVAAPHLEKLNLNTGDTVNFSMREGNHCIIIYKLEPTTGMLRTRAYIGMHMPLFSSSMGKLFLAFAPEGYLEKYWREEKEAIVGFTANTIVDLDVMRHELDRIQAVRLSFDREENELGTGCVAAPIFTLNKRVDYAVSVSAPMSRMDHKRQAVLAEAVLETAKNISAELGGGFH